MKKILSLGLIVLALTSCNSASEEAKEVVDSLEHRKDTLVSNADSAMNKQIDSLKERKEELKDKIDSTFDARKDSAKKQ
jgi:uncharacterized protein YdcH (DUF465 family)